MLLQPLQGRAQLTDELLIHLGGAELLAHQVLDQGVEAHLEPLAEDRVGALRWPGAGVVMPAVELGFKVRWVRVALNDEAEIAELIDRTTSTHNPDMTWDANWTFIGSNGADSDLYMGNGAAAELLAGGQVANGRMYYFFLKPEFVAQYPLPEPVKAQAKASPAKPATATEATTRSKTSSPPRRRCPARSSSWRPRGTTGCSTT